MFLGAVLRLGVGVKFLGFRGLEFSLRFVGLVCRGVIFWEMGRLWKGCGFRFRSDCEVGRFSLIHGCSGRRMNDVMIFARLWEYVSRRGLLFNFSFFSFLIYWNLEWRMLDLRQL